jgi:hypothetical protein
MDIEAKAVDTLLHRGVRIDIPKRSLLRYVGKKDRSFTIRQSYLGTLFEISRVALRLDYDEKRIADDAFSESKRLVKKHAKGMTLICAIAILNSWWGIRLLAWPLSYYLLWRLTPQRLAQLSLTVMQLNNISDFINSIRLMSGARVTAPKDLSPDDNGG